MKLNGGLQANWQDEYILLRKKWNNLKLMHPNLKIEWEDYYNENQK